jgi:spermidine/putrescine transport system permease protein
MNNTFLGSKSFATISFILAVPILIIIGTAFYYNEFAGENSTFSISGFSELLSPLRINEILKIAGRALLLSLGATFIAFGISYLLIFNASRSFQLFFFVIITLPFLINESVRVFSWQYVLAENGVFNSILGLISQSKVTLFDGSNSSNVYLVMLISCIPFGIFINSASLQTIPEIYWKTSDDLNLKPFNKFIKVALPFSKFALITSLVIIFFISFAMSSEVNFLGGDSKISTRNLVLSLMSANKFQAIFSLGFSMIFLLLSSVVLYQIINRSKTVF